MEKPVIPASLLFIEDHSGESDDIMRKFNAVKLRNTISFVSSSQQAREMLSSLDAENCPDLILFDLHIPAKEIKLHLDSVMSVSVCKNVSVIIFVDSELDEEILRLAGVTYYFLRRPFEIQKLLHIMLQADRFGTIIVRS